ncbi:MAG: HDIG domain-containing metalloprotein [Candidatus Firestonebacteria bacterium]
MKINNLLNTVYNLSKKKKLKVYIVGGFIRDYLLKKPLEEIKDLDFAVFGNTIKFAKEFSKTVKGSLVILSEKFQLVRVIVNKVYTCDFTHGKGKNILHDLKERDFTINSLAVDINHKDEIKEYIIDKFNSKKDLKKKFIKEINKKIYFKDPVRLLRAIRFSATLKFNIAKKTKNHIKEFANLITYSSRERIRDELFKILEVNNSFKYIKLLDKLTLLENIFPDIKTMKGVEQPGYHHLDVWGHSLETLKNLELIIKKIDLNLPQNIKENICNHLNKKIGGFCKLSLLKLISLFHDIGKPETKFVDKDGHTHFYYHENVGMNKFSKIGRELKLSNKEIKIGKIIIKNHLRVGYLCDLKKITKKAVRKFLRDCGDLTIDVLLLSLSDRLSAKGVKVDEKIINEHKKVIEKLFVEYYKVTISTPLPKLINGYDLMKKFNLKPSPLIGALLDKVKEAQELKKISTRKQAWALVKLAIGAKIA